MAWPTIDETKPVGTDKVKSIDDAERETRTFMINALAEISNFTKSGTQPALKTTKWTTATRPTGANLVDRVTGFNTTLGYEEYYDLATTTWKAKGATTAKYVSYTPSGILTATDIQNAIGQIMSMLIPAGAVQPFAMSVAPAGWLKCNGAAVSRTTYAALFTAIGTTFGAGNGSTTFNLPDLRGEFIRGYDDSRGVDSGRVIGSSQTDQIQNITGSISSLIGYTPSATGAFNWIYRGNCSFAGYEAGHHSGTFSIDASRVARTGTETRPRNIALLYCIKY
ncbi:MAG: tail fiber protein [Bacillota bacterium]